MQEIAIAARLQHPHILAVHDSGEADGFLYYVMPYVEGESLCERLQRHGELPAHEAVRLLAEITDALAHAHARGVGWPVPSRGAENARTRARAGRGPSRHQAGKRDVVGAACAGDGLWCGQGRERSQQALVYHHHVANVPEGSVRKSGNTLRITAQLIRASDSSHLWSETYDRKLTDVFKVQDDDAGAVVGALRLKLLPARRQTARHFVPGPGVPDQFLFGRQFANRNTQEG